LKKAAIGKFPAVARPSLGQGTPPPIARTERAKSSPGRNDPARQILQIVIYYAALSLRKGTMPMDKAPVEDLASKHAALHALIDEEENRPHPDEDLLHRLKKEKLRLKDAMLGH
jgi:hypothetical protein